MTPRKSHPNSPQSGRKSSVSVRSSAADEYFESKMKGKMKKAHSKTSLGAASSLGSLLESTYYFHSSFHFCDFSLLIVYKNQVL